MKICEFIHGMRNSNVKKQRIPVWAKIIGGVIAFASANLVCGICIAKRNMNKVNRTKGQNNLVNTTILKRGKVDIADNTDNAYIACFTGALDINVSYPEKQNMNVELTSVLADVKIHIPENVRIICDGPMGVNCSSARDDIDMKDLPEIHFKIESKLSKVVFVTEQ